MPRPLSCSVTHRWAVVFSPVTLRTRTNSTRSAAQRSSEMASVTELATVWLMRRRPPLGQHTTSLRQHVPNSSNDVVGVGYADRFERWAERHRYGRRTDSSNRRAQPIERELGDPCRDLSTGAEGHNGFVDDHRATGPGDRLDDRLDVERDERPDIDDLDGEPVRGKSVGGLNGHLDHPRPRGDGHVATRARDACPAQRKRSRIHVRQQPSPAVQTSILDVDDRIRISDRRAHERVGILDGGGSTTFNPGTWETITS